MARKNVYAKRGGVLLALLLFLGCNATTKHPVNQMAAVKSAPNEASAITPTEATPASVAKPTLMLVPYADKPLEAPVEAPETTPSAPETIIIHRAELRGHVETQKGNRLTIQPLVVTSPEIPVPGCMADLWIAAMGDDGVLDWQHFSEVKVATALQFGMPMEVDIVEDEPERGANKLARAKLPPGSKVRIQWEW